MNAVHSVHRLQVLQAAVLKHNVCWCKILFGERHVVYLLLPLGIHSMTKTFFVRNKDLDINVHYLFDNEYT